MATTAPGLSELAAAADCSGSALGRTGDYSMICNLPVSAFTIAASDINVFVGYANGLTQARTASSSGASSRLTRWGSCLWNIDVGACASSGS